jgi:60 kDa SS-A/Ro ribonucleoprotein
MAKFNTSSGSRLKTTNREGAEAYVQSPKFQLASLLLTSFVKDQFYRSEDETLGDLKNLLKKVEPLFSAKAAIYARTEFGMRSISHAVAAELAKIVKGESWTKNFFNKVVYRPDDVTEILAYYLNNYKKPIPNSLKKGLGLALQKFDEYSLAKYRGEKHDVSLVDAVNLVRPKATEALTKLMKDELRSTDTWETRLTQAGQTAESEEDKKKKKAEAWESLVTSGKIGYFALLRNLRNIAEQADKEVVAKALDLLVDKKRIKKSLVLPFRFQTAADEIGKLNNTHARKILMALSEAMDIAVDNVPELSGKTLVAIDASGSMSGRPQDIASLFGAILFKATDSQMLMFADTGGYLQMNPSDSVLTIAEKLRNTAHRKFGGGTNFNAIFEESSQKFDRVIILSDMQAWVDSGWDSNVPTQSFADYKRRTGADPVVFSFDLAGYGTLQFPERNVYQLAGFSEKIFDVMKLLEQDREALIHKIESVEL